MENILTIVPFSMYGESEGKSFGIYKYDPKGRTIIFTSDGMLGLHLFSIKDAQFASMDREERAKAVIKANNERINEIKGKDKAFLLGLDPDNVYVPYTDILRIRVRKLLSTITIFKKDGGEITITSTDKTVDLGPISNITKVGLKDTIETSTFIPKPKLILKILGFIVLFIIIGLIISFLIH